MNGSRWATAAWVIAGVAWVANGLLGLSAVDGSGGFYVSEVCWVVVHTLVLAGIVGLLASGATGDLRWGRTALQLAVVARVLFIAFEAASIVKGTDELLIFPVAVVGTGLGMLVGGIAVARSGRWCGWGRFAPLSVGAYPFLAIVPVAIATGSRPPDAIVAGWGLTLVAVGVASGAAVTRSRTAPPATRPTPATARRA